MQKRQQKFTKTYFDYFDTASVIIGYEKSEEEFDRVCAFVEKELLEYHRLYDIYNFYDETVNLASINKLYDGEHKTFAVDKRIMDLLLYSKEMHELTRGETNIAMGSVLSIWHDYRERAISDPKDAKLPSYDRLKAAALHTDIENLILDENSMTVLISDRGMKLDVGAVAKGYATEMIARELETRGISGYTLNIGGNIRTIGAKPDGSSWVIGIENPDAENGEPYLKYLNIAGEAVVTSGSYQRYFVVDGKSYHHIIDKETLFPSEYFTSVSVVCKNSALADALSTALFSMSLEDGLELIESLPDAEALWYGKDGEIMLSSGFSEYTKK